MALRAVRGRQERPGGPPYQFQGSALDKVEQKERSGGLPGRLPRQGEGFSMAQRERSGPVQVDNEAAGNSPAGRKDRFGKDTKRFGKVDMKTKKEIEKQIKALKDVRPKIVPRSAFGDDNLAQIDAQIAVLKENMDIDDIYSKYDHSGVSEETLDAAQTAREWRDGDSDIEDLAADWPLKS